MAADGDIKAAEFLRDTVGENPKHKVYEKRIEMMMSETGNTIANEWVKAVLASSDAESL